MAMRRSWLILAASGLALAGAFAQDAAAPKTLLAFCGSKGFRHTACSYGKPILTKMGEDSGQFRVLCSEDPKVFNPDFLKGIACVVLNNTTGSFMDADQRQALLEYVRNGGALVGIHAATDAMYDWPEYNELLGGWFDGHPWSEKVTVKVEVPDHPACQPVDKPWVINDEIYQQRNWSRDKICVLMTLDPNGTDFTKPGIKREDKDFGIAWCRKVGKGRVFYTALGHREDVWDNPMYQAHLLGGILWAMGVQDFPCEPHPKPQ